MKLNQVIAVEKGVKSQTYAHLTEINKVAKKPPVFEGMTRDYQPKDDAGEKLPSERRMVQFRVADLLGSARTELTKLFDLTAQKDIANGIAKAPIVIEGKPLTDPLPATTLLFLEKQLVDIRTLVADMPELDVAEDWSFDGQSGLYRTKPVATTRSKKVQRALVLLAPTEHHPGQAQMVTEDELAGIWQTTRQSGAMPKPEKKDMLERVDALIIAVKQAREQANMTDASAKPQLGAAVFEYLFNKG